MLQAFQCYTEKNFFERIEMGTRIHKRLGYGYVTDVNAEKTVTDMLNPDSFFFTRSPFKSPEEAFADFISFAAQWEKDNEAYRPALMDPYMLAHSEKKPRFDPHDLIGRSDNDEDGTSAQDVFVLTPLGMNSEWHRYDDTIDYIEDMSILKNYDLQEEVHVLENGIWPYSGSYIRTDTRQRVAPHLMEWVRARNDGGCSYASMDELAQLGGFESHEEAERLVLAKPSDDAVVLALWGEVFKDPQDAYRMRSLLYKYWR